MSRTAAARAAIGADRPDAASVLALVQAIERHGEGAPAARAFRSALRRKGDEAHVAGGPAALDDLLRAVAESDPGRSDARRALLRGVWTDLLPSPGGRTQP